MARGKKHRGFGDALVPRRPAAFKAGFADQVKVRAGFCGEWARETSEGGELSLSAFASLGKALGNISEEFFQGIGIGQTL